MISLVGKADIVVGNAPYISGLLKRKEFPSIKNCTI